MKKLIIMLVMIMALPAQARVEIMCSEPCSGGGVQEPAPTPIVVSRSGGSSFNYEAQIPALNRSIRVHNRNVHFSTTRYGVAYLEYEDGSVISDSGVEHWIVAKVGKAKVWYEPKRAYDLNDSVGAYLDANWKDEWNRILLGEVEIN